MKPILIVLRGNSDSGKTTIARQLQIYFGSETMLISQDLIRRDVIYTRDRENNLDIDLIEQIALYVKKYCSIVIVEGILIRKRYRAMMSQLIDAFEGNVLVYYFNLSSEETFKRHRTKGEDIGFTEKDLINWYCADDWLGVNNESILTSELNKEDIEKSIINGIHEMCSKS